MSLLGVNLGGWLVLERWMTPSVFEGTDARNEYELAQTNEGRRRIRQHHEAFIAEADMKWLQRKGVRLLRVPVGYWVFGDVSHYVGAIDRLDWLFSQAKKYDLQLLLVLHGAPGAQNAEAHSGSGNWPGRSTAWLSDADAKQQAVEVLCRLAERYGHHERLWGLELLNEPAVDVTGWRLVRFYRRAARAVHPLLAHDVRVVFSDGFTPLRLTGALWPLRLQRQVMIDMHMYYCFASPDGVKPTPRQAMRAVKMNRWLLVFVRLFQPVIVGEWSAMLGRRVPDGTTKQFIATQAQAYRGAKARIYWSYKTEAPGRWNFRDMVRKGMIQ